MPDPASAAGDAGRLQQAGHPHRGLAAGREGAVLVVVDPRALRLVRTGDAAHATPKGADVGLVKVGGVLVVDPQHDVYPLSVAEQGTEFVPWTRQSGAEQVPWHWARLGRQRPSSASAW
eukprot:scaffold1658_cov115-Isochrysis_galbana.AAC.6